MILSGDFVRCYFPFREVEGPGPSPHIVLCAGTDSAKKNAIVFYTTSQIDYPGLKRPRQYMFIDAERATQLGQKLAFNIDASRVALLPLGVEYFPDLDRGVIKTFGRSPDLASRVVKKQIELAAAGFAIERTDARRSLGPKIR
jgi:hypothetical protein